MDIGAILESSIGIIFVFFLMSLLVTALNELLAALFHLRSSQLKDAIRRMLGGDQALTDSFFAHPLVRLATKSDAGLPSYIKTESFSEIVLDLIGSKGTLSTLGSLYGGACGLSEKLADSPLPDEVKKLFSSFAAAAKQDVEAFKSRLGEWFDASMERVSGWYNRRMRWISLVVGLLLAVAINVDAVTIVGQLMRYDSLRAKVVDQALQYVAANPTAADSVKAQLTDQIGANVASLKQASILGWGGSAATGLIDPASVPSSILNVLLRLAGWLITACATSLGAPFWFDVLNKLSNLRAAGSIPGAKKPVAAAAAPAGGTP